MEHTYREEAVNCAIECMKLILNKDVILNKDDVCYPIQYTDLPEKLIKTIDDYMDVACFPVYDDGYREGYDDGFNKAKEEYYDEN